MQKINPATWATGNTVTVHLRIRPQDLSLEPIEVDVFSWAEAMDYARNNPRDMVEFQIRKDSEDVVSGKLCWFDKLDKWNLYFRQKNFMLGELNIDIFRNLATPILSDDEMAVMESLDE